MIEFQCPQCAKLLKTTEDHAGASARCPGCGEVVVVPGLARGPQVSEDVSPWVEEPEPQYETTVKCPRCAEQIAPSATRCPYCRELVRHSLRSDERPSKAGTIMTLALVSWVPCCPVFQVAGIIALVLGFTELSDIHRGRVSDNNRGMVYAGLVLGGLSLAAYAVLYGAAIVSGALEDMGRF